MCPLAMLGSQGIVVKCTAAIGGEALATPALVVQRPENFIRWIRHYSGSKINFTLNVFQGFHTLPNLAVVRVCIFACTRGNTEIFARIETGG